MEFEPSPDELIMLVQGYIQKLEEVSEYAITCADVRNWAEWDEALGDIAYAEGRIVEFLRIHRNVLEQLDSESDDDE